MAERKLQEHMAEREAARKVTYVADMRALADYLEEHPDLIPAWGTIELSHFFSTEEDTPKGIELAKKMGGFEKESGSSYLYLTHAVGIHKVRVLINHEKLCVKTITGTRTVPAKPAQIIEAVPEHVEETFEWVCPPSILALGEDPEALQELMDEHSSPNPDGEGDYVDQDTAVQTD